MICSIMIPTSLSEKMKIIALMRVKAGCSCAVWIDHKKPAEQLFPREACNIGSLQIVCYNSHNLVHVDLHLGFSDQ